MSSTTQDKYRSDGLGSQIRGSGATESVPKVSVAPFRLVFFSQLNLRGSEESRIERCNLRDHIGFLPHRLTSERCFSHWPNCFPVCFQFELVCEKKYLKRVSSLVFMAGVLMGAMLIGYLSDKYGRRATMFSVIGLQVPITNQYKKLSEKNRKKTNQIQVFFLCTDETDPCTKTSLKFFEQMVFASRTCLLQHWVNRQNSPRQNSPGQNSPK